MITGMADTISKFPDRRWKLILPSESEQDTMTWIKVEFLFSQPAIITTVNQNMIVNFKSNITRLHFLT